MKTRITLLIACVATVTLSFTFANVDTKNEDKASVSPASSLVTPLGGLIADEVVK